MGGLRSAEKFFQILMFFLKTLMVYEGFIHQLNDERRRPRRGTPAADQMTKSVTEKIFTNVPAPPYLEEAPGRVTLIKYNTFEGEKHVIGVHSSEPFALFLVW